MKARIAKIGAPCRIEIFEEEMPEPKEGEFLVKVIACGLCHSDVPFYYGSKNPTRRGGPDDSASGDMFPYPIGHELNGVVMAVGPGVQNVKVGDRIGGLVFSSFATHVMCTVNSLIGKIVEGVPMETTLAEPLMCITNIVRAANPEIGDCVAVVGAGFMGLLTIAGLSHCPVREVIAIDLVDERLQLAREMGATRIINSQREDPVAAVMEITGGRGVDVAIDITGRYAGLALATKIIKVRRGKILAPSFYTKPEMVDIGPELLARVPIIHSVHPGYSFDYARDVETGVWAAKTGILPIEKLITHRFKLDELPKAFETLVRNPPGFIKGVVVMD